MENGKWHPPQALHRLALTPHLTPGAASSARESGPPGGQTAAAAVVMGSPSTLLVSRSQRTKTDKGHNAAPFFFACRC